MHEAEFSKFSISILGEDNNPRKKGDFSNLTYEKLCNWINRMEISQEVKKECLLILKKYPHSALKSFVHNFQNVHLRIAQANARKNISEKNIELGDSGYLSARQKEKIDSFEKENTTEEISNNVLPEIPNNKEQTDFFPNVK